MVAAEFYMKVSGGGIWLESGARRFNSNCFFLKLEVYLEMSLGMSYLRLSGVTKLTCAFPKAHPLVPTLCRG